MPVEANSEKLLKLQGYFNNPDTALKLVKGYLAPKQGNESPTYNVDGFTSKEEFNEFYSLWNDCSDDQKKDLLKSYIKQFSDIEVDSDDNNIEPYFKVFNVNVSNHNQWNTSTTFLGRKHAENNVFNEEHLNGFVEKIEEVRAAKTKNVEIAKEAAKAAEVAKAAKAKNAATKLQAKVRGNIAKQNFATRAMEAAQEQLDQAFGKGNNLPDIKLLQAALEFDAKVGGAAKFSVVNGDNIDAVFGKDADGNYARAKFSSEVRNEFLKHCVKALKSGKLDEKVIGKLEGKSDSGTVADGESAAAPSSSLIELELQRLYKDACFIQPGKSAGFRYNAAQTFVELVKTLDAKFFEGNGVVGSIIAVRDIAKGDNLAKSNYFEIVNQTLNAKKQIDMQAEMQSIRAACPEADPERSEYISDISKKISAKYPNGLDSDVTIPLELSKSHGSSVQRLGRYFRSFVDPAASERSLTQSIVDDLSKEGRTDLNNAFIKGLADATINDAKTKPGAVSINSISGRPLAKTNSRLFGVNIPFTTANASLLSIVRRYEQDHPSNPAGEQYQLTKDLLKTLVPDDYAQYVLLRGTVFKEETSLRSGMPHAKMLKTLEVDPTDPKLTGEIEWGRSKNRRDFRYFANEGYNGMALSLIRQNPDIAHATLDVDKLSRNGLQFLMEKAGKEITGPSKENAQLIRDIINFSGTRNGASIVDAKDINGRNAMHYAVNSKNSAAMLDAITQGITDNYRKRNGIEATKTLTYAQQNSINTAISLSLTKLDKFGRSAIEEAILIESDAAKIVENLIKIDGLVTLKDEKGETIQGIADLNLGDGRNIQDIIFQSGKVEVLKKMIENPQFGLADKEFFAEIATPLLKHSASLSSESLNGFVALFPEGESRNNLLQEAIKAGNKDVFKAIIDMGNASTPPVKTALTPEQLATMIDGNQLDIVKYAIEKGFINDESKVKMGKEEVNFATYAAAKGSSDIFDLIVSNANKTPGGVFTKMLMQAEGKGSGKFADMTPLTIALDGAKNNSLYVNTSDRFVRTAMSILSTDHKLNVAGVYGDDKNKDPQSILKDMQGIGIKSSLRGILTASKNFLYNSNNFHLSDLQSAMKARIEAERGSDEDIKTIALNNSDNVNNRNSAEITHAFSKLDLAKIKEIAAVNPEILGYEVARSRALIGRGNMINVVEKALRKDRYDVLQVIAEANPDLLMTPSDDYKGKAPIQVLQDRLRSIISNSDSYGRGSYFRSDANIARDVENILQIAKSAGIDNLLTAEIEFKGTPPKFDITHNAGELLSTRSTLTLSEVAANRGLNQVSAILQKYGGDRNPTAETYLGQANRRKIAVEQKLKESIADPINEVLDNIKKDTTVWAKRYGYTDLENKLTDMLTKINEMEGFIGSHSSHEFSQILDENGEVIVEGDALSNQLESIRTSLQDTIKNYVQSVNSSNGPAVERLNAAISELISKNEKIYSEFEKRAAEVSAEVEQKKSEIQAVKDSFSAIDESEFVKFTELYKDLSESLNVDGLALVENNQKFNALNERLDEYDLTENPEDIINAFSKLKSDIESAMGDDLTAETDISQLQNKLSELNALKEQFDKVNGFIKDNFEIGDEGIEVKDSPAVSASVPPAPETPAPETPGPETTEVSVGPKKQGFWNRMFGSKDANDPSKEAAEKAAKEAAKKQAAEMLGDYVGGENSAKATTVPDLEASSVRSR